jgi:DNA-binding LytR/AlgR family response regulator
MKTKVVVVDDDFSALSAIKNYCEQLDLSVIGVFGSSKEFIDLFETLNFDIAILDYNMPQYNGLQVAELLNSKNIPVIFATGHRDEIAAKAWDINCIDCVEKPVTIDKIKNAIQKYKQSNNNNINVIEHLDLKIYGNEIARIKLSEIAFITSCEADTNSDDKYLQTFSNKGYRITKKKIEELLKILPPTEFLRVNRSSIISRKAIDSYLPNFEQVTLSVNYIAKNICSENTETGLVKINISTSFKDSFKAWM